MCDAAFIHHTIILRGRLFFHSTVDKEFTLLFFISLLSRFSFLFRGISSLTEHIWSNPNKNTIAVRGINVYDILHKYSKVTVCNPHLQIVV